MINTFCKIIDIRTKLEVFFDKHPLHFSLVENGKKLNVEEAHYVLNTLNENAVNTQYLEVQCAE